MKKHLIRRAAGKFLRQFDPSFMPIFPVQLFWEITTICNLRCKTCYKTAWNLPSFDVSDELYEKVIRELFPYIYHLEIVGLGEALCSKKFWPLFETCLSMGIRIGTSSNGLLINQSVADQFASAGSIITISIDGRYNDTLQYVRPGITEDIIENAMRCFQEAARKFPDTGFKWSVHTVLLKSNIEEIPDLIEWISRFNCPVISFSQMNAEGRTDPFIKETLVKSDDILIRALPAIEKAAESHGVTIVFPPSIKQLMNGNRIDWGKQPGKYFQKCYSPWREVQISVDGKVYPCCTMGKILGDMKDHSFREIWNGAEYKRFRKRIHSGDPPECCRICSMEYGITGGQPDYFDRFEKEVISK